MWKILASRWVYKNPKKRTPAVGEDEDADGGEGQGDGRTNGGSLMQRGRIGTASPAVTSEEWLQMHTGTEAASVDPADEFFFRFFSNKVR